MGKSLGEIAYNAYGETTGFKNYQQLPMPAWDEHDNRYVEGMTVLTGIIKQAWENSALKVSMIGKEPTSSMPRLVDTMEWRNLLTPEQIKILAGIQAYAKDPYPDSGYNLKILAAKLADLLDWRNTPE